MSAQPVFRPSLRHINLLIVFICVFSFTACSDGRIAQLEETTKKLKAEISDMRGLQAEQASAIRQVSLEMHSLTGRVEEVQHVSTGKTQELEQTITKLKSRVPPPAGVPEDLLNMDDERIAAINGPAADTFRQALQQLRTGDMDAARDTFSTFISANPGTAFTDNAIFWLGICYEKLGKYDQAVGAFSDVFGKYPAEDFVAPALFYLADTFAKTGAKQDAVLTLQKLLDEHPNSVVTDRAKTLLAELAPPPPPPSRKRR